MAGAQRNLVSRDDATPLGVWLDDRELLAVVRSREDDRPQSEEDAAMAQEAVVRRTPTGAHRPPVPSPPEVAQRRVAHTAGFELEPRPQRHLVEDSC